MAEEPRAYPLVMEMGKHSRLRWRWVVIIVSALFLLFFVLAAHFDGVLTNLSGWKAWRDYLDGPALTIYTLAIYPFIWRLWWRAAQTFQTLLPVDDGSSKQVALEVPSPNRRWEWAAMIIGAVFWLSLWQPWGWGVRWETGYIWLAAYDVVTQMILFGLLGWLLYSSLAGSRYFNRLGLQNLNLDLFDTGTLIPIARSSLGFSLAFIGGISLSLIFQTREDLARWENIMVWAILVCFTILLFFISLRSIHNAMTGAKRRELDLVQKHLMVASRELKERAADDSLRGMEELSSTITAWVTYEKRVKEAPTWPFSEGIVRRLAMSILMPASIYIMKVISQYWARFGF